MEECKMKLTLVNAEHEYRWFTQQSMVKLTVVLYPSLLVIIVKKRLLLTKVEMSKGFTFNGIAVNICKIKWWVSLIDLL